MKIAPRPGMLATLAALVFAAAASAAQAPFQIPVEYYKLATG